MAPAPAPEVADVAGGPEGPEGPVAEDTAVGSAGVAAGPGGEDPADRAPSEPADTEAEATGRTGGRWRKAAFAAAVAVLLLGGSAFFQGAHHLRSTASAQNRALTDTAATDRVSGEVGDGLARIFSYTPTGADATERSARSVLAGRAARQYGDLFAQLRANLETQKITLSTQAVRTGVIELDGNTARLLVLLDQTSRRDEGATTSAAAQLTVTARFHGDRWQIVDIKAR
ncbi:hypothetical protein ACFYM0_03940 [Streptomyces sp. NPDC006487]|uniref:hypothetical protein n=1 Tax=Streptomyces sp. NPDC006487 TaxID=3364748 RepID=UPI0036BB01AF